MVFLVNNFEMMLKELCVIILIIFLIAKSESVNPADTIAVLQRPMFEVGGQCVAENCDISCANGAATNLFLDIQIAQNKKKKICNEVDTLILNNYNFHDETIPHMWTPVTFEIRKLRIKHSDIQCIKAGAFQQYEFIEIFLDNLNIKDLEDRSLVGLIGLRSLRIKQNTPIKSIPCKLLAPVQFTLVELQFSTGLTSLDVLTSCCESFDVVKNVDFSFNNLNKITTDTFKKFSTVEDINLSHSNISSIEHGVFRFSRKLRNIDLSYNRLTIISALIFRPSKHVSNVHFWLNENPWRCCCKFQHFVKHSLVHEPDKIFCVADSRNESLPLMKVSCRALGLPPMARDHASNQRLSPGISIPTGSISNENSTDDSLATSANEVQLTNVTFAPSPIWSKGGKNHIDLKCIVCNGTNCSKSEFTRYSRIRVRSKSLDFTIIPRTDFSVIVNIKSNMEMPLALVWFNRATREFFKMEINYKDYGLGCLRNINQTILVDELTVNATYTFCLVHIDSPMTSPFNCMAYRSFSPNEFDDYVWLSTTAKAWCISIAVLIILCSILFGGCVMYCIIKKKPTLLRGSKRVIMPKKSSEDIMVLPRCGSLSNETKGIDNSSFLSNRCMHLRRSSTTSVDSSYVSPNLYEVIPAAKNKQSERRNAVPTVCSIIKLTPPPGVKRTSNDPLPSIPVEGYSELEFKEYRCGSSSA